MEGSPAISNDDELAPALDFGDQREHVAVGQRRGEPGAEAVDGQRVAGVAEFGLRKGFAEGGTGGNIRFTGAVPQLSGLCFFGELISQDVG